MEDYISIPKKIKAVQWLPPMFVDIVQTHIGCGEKLCPVCKGDDATRTIYLVKNGLSHIYVNYSDYVIKYPDGKVGVMNADAFHKQYQKEKIIEPLKNN